MNTLTPLDWGLLASLAISIVVGVMRGLVFELMALAGWVVAYVAAMALSPRVAPYVPIGEPGSTLHHAAAVVLTFVVALLLWGLLARLVRLAIAATPLTVPDRVLGAGFGLLRGLVLLVVVATVVSLTPAVRSPAWRASTGAQWLGVLLEGLRPALPAPIAQALPARQSAGTPRGQ